MCHSGSRPLPLSAAALLITAIMILTGCMRRDHPDVKLAEYDTLDQHDLRSVTVSQDRQAGVITLSGIVGANDRKMRAEQLAQQSAPGYSIVDRIQVDNAGIQSEVQAASQAAQVDNSIEDHFRAALALHRALKTQNIECTANNGILTLKGTVKTAQEKREAEDLAMKVPQVQHVVNEIQVHPGKPSPANS